MNEQNVGKLDVEAILANEELMKRLAAKVLDIIQQKPDAGIVCQGYYCNMAKGDQPEDWKVACKKKLDSLEMELEDGLAAVVAEDYRLSAEELDQVVTEIKTSESYTGKLSRADMSRAVSKVLADNEIMRRKGSVEAMKVDVDRGSYFCVPYAPNSSWCRPCGPNSKTNIGSPWFDICRTGGPWQKEDDSKICPGLFRNPIEDRGDIVVRPGGVEELINRVNRLEEAVAIPSVEGLGNRLNRLEAIVGLKKI